MIGAIRVGRPFLLWGDAASNLNRYFKSYKDVFMIGIVLLVFLCILALLWIVFIPSFNPSTIRNTLSHKSDVEMIASDVINAQFPNDSMPPPIVEVELVYEYTPTCIVTLVTLVGNISQRREILVFEVNQSNQWIQTLGLNITFEPENGILPTRPDYLSCG